MLDELHGLLGNAANLKYRGGLMPGRLPEIGSVIDQPSVIETTYEIVKKHTAVEESVLQFYIDLSRVVPNDEAYDILRGLIEDERSHHEMLDKLMSDLMELYGEQLALYSE